MIEKYGLSVFGSNAAEHKGEACLDEEDTDQNAESDRHAQRLKERSDADQNCEYAENQLQNPDTGAGSSRDRNGIDDRDDTHQHEPYRCHYQHDAFGKEQRFREWQHDDTQYYAQNIKHKVNAESFVDNDFDNTDNTKNKHQYHDKITCVHEGEQGSEDTGKTSGNQQDTQNDE